MRKAVIITLVLTACFACQSEIERLGHHYQQHQDYESLAKVVDLVEPGVDTSYVRTILGTPIDMGFDLRYTVDSTGPNGCTIGAVFHYDQQGKVDDRWIGEICE